MQDLIHRISNNWTRTRFLYLIVGAVLLISSLPDSEWLGIFGGGYFFSMGLFAFGCASGQCLPQHENPNNPNSNNNELEVEFEEISTK